MIQAAMVSLCVFFTTIAVARRNPTGNAAFVALLFGLLAAFGPAVGAY